ncbi:MAG: tail fiber domain-containing protein [Nitrospirae bacterium]|nr:tail fiber domain-containing protein [Nitrospirota bacterium]
MKMKILGITLIFLFAASYLYADDGDLIVNGRLGVGTGTPPAQKLDVAGNIGASGEIIGTIGSGYGQFRAVHGNNYGAMIRNDGSSTYFLLTDFGSPYNTWNSLRPFTINNASGNTQLGSNALYVQHGGKVGIGTTSPAAKLQIVSNVAMPLENPLKSSVTATAVGGNTDYNMGYKFVPSVNGTITQLGLRCDTGTRTVRLYDMYGNVLASANITAAGAGAWVYSNIAPVNVVAGIGYVVATRNNGSLNYCRTLNLSYPATVGSITISESRYAAATDAMPTVANNTIMYGQADITIQPAPASVSLATDGSAGIGTSTPGGYKLYVAGSAYTTGAWQSSDEKFKKNILQVDNALEKVLSLDGVSYEWKTDEYKEKGFPDGRHYGFIAQDIEKVLPEVIRDGPEDEKAVAYAEIIPVLIEAIKEQQKAIEKLKSDLARLKPGN